MKLVFFIAIILFFALEFIYANSSLCVLHIRLVYNNFKSIFNKKKNSHEENVTIIIPTLINCGIMKCGRCEYRTKSINLIKSN